MISHASLRVLIFQLRYNGYASKVSFETMKKQSYASALNLDNRDQKNGLADQVSHCQMESMLLCNNQLDLPENAHRSAES